MFPYLSYLITNELPLPSDSRKENSQDSAQISQQHKIGPSWNCIPWSHQEALVASLCGWKPQMEGTAPREVRRQQCQSLCHPTFTVMYACTWNFPGMVHGNSSAERHRASGVAAVSKLALGYSKFPLPCHHCPVGTALQGQGTGFDL